ncbi:hypothetical protein C8Q75DRAFT_769883 [Abortiporus biennis]|nr:hypothetical protein C8Q75DRAFT_769883 [Abortiporus biennis]
MQKLLVKAFDLLPPPRWVSTSDEEVLPETLNSWRNKAPSPAHEEATEKLLALLVDKIRKRREATNSSDSTD